MTDVEQQTFWSNVNFLVTVYFLIQEMLIKQLARESIGKNKTLEYRHVADYVQSDNNLEFLHPILPKKITGKTFLKLLKETDDSDSSDESDSSSSSSSSEEDESSSSGSNEKENEEKEE